MLIGDRAITPGHPVYVIAEIGVNHDGSAPRALELIDAAARADADAVKFQLFEPRDLLSADARLALYQHAARETDPLAMLRRLRLDRDNLDRCIQHARRRGLHAIVTPFTPAAARDAAQQPWHAHKLASPDIIHKPLVEALARTGRPLILSTGAATADEIARTLRWLTSSRRAPHSLALLHCTSAYPTPLHLAGFHLIASLRAILDHAGLPHAAVGFSDHTDAHSIDAGARAVRAGACLLERHLTHDRAAPGPDHAASLEPDAFARYVQLARAEPTRPVEPADPHRKRPRRCELDVRRSSRQSVVATRDLPAGRTLTPEDLAVKRPAGGVEPHRLASLTGRTLARPVRADTRIRQDDLAHAPTPDADADHPPGTLPNTRRVLVLTGTRADFGLLEPVIAALHRHPALTPLVVAAGAHLLPPARTIDEVAQRAPLADELPMQTPGETGRLADARALAAGVRGAAELLETIEPHWALVLGDRIEALALAAAASVAGVALAHIHGGDRAEGVADEAIRHAVTKLAHLHLAATPASADRILRMGEPPERVHTVGSPAADAALATAHNPPTLPTHLQHVRLAVLMHPVGRPEHDDADPLAIAHALALLTLPAETVLWLAPNHDPGRERVLAVRAQAQRDGRCTTRDHLPAPIFRALLHRLAQTDGALIGNSSAALIEAAVLRCPAVDIGPRQHGRETPASVHRPRDHTHHALAHAVLAARNADRRTLTHPYGDGRSAERIAHILAATDPDHHDLLHKRNSY